MSNAYPIIVFDHIDAHRRSIAEILFALGYTPTFPETFSVTDVLAQQGAAVLIHMGDGSDPHALIAFCDQMARQAPTYALIMYGRAPSMQFLQDAMAAGVRRFLNTPVVARELEQTLHDLVQADPSTSSSPTPIQLRRQEPAAATLGHKLIVCFSPKGGVGRSTVAVNMAVALRQTGQRVTLVDGNMHSGNVAVMLNLSTDKSIMLAIDDHGGMDKVALRTNLTTHSSGLVTLLPPNAPEHGDLIDTIMFNQALALLREWNDYVVVDTPSHYDDRVMSLFDSADHLIVPIAPDLAAIKNLADFLRLSQLLNIDTAKIRLVLTRANSVPPTQVRQMEEFLGQRFHYQVVSDGRRATSAINDGVPVLLGHPDCQLARDLRLIADGVLEQDHKEQLAPAAGGDGARRRRWFAR